jgi:hypothetical protein
VARSRPCLRTPRWRGGKSENTLAAKKLNNELMKSMITLSAITVVAAFALVGCNQNNPGSSTDTSATNSSMSGASSTIGGTTNTPATNSLPDMNTNLPASTNQ